MKHIYPYLYRLATAKHKRLKGKLVQWGQVCSRRTPHPVIVVY